MNILVVVARPNEPARAETVESDVYTFQRLVGGCLELVQHQNPVDSSLYLYVNEDGKALGLVPNLSIVADVILGPIVVSRCDDGGEDIGLDEDLARRAADWLDRARGLDVDLIPIA